MSVEPLPGPEYTRVWKRFFADFSFRAGNDPLNWPGIVEPPGSATWRLTALDKHPEYELLEWMVSVIRKGLISCADEVYALDWRHESYRLATTAKEWPLSPFPDGDYHIYLTPDFRLGTFGHPWEYTICVFGEPLVTAISAELTLILGKPLRRSA